MQYFCRNKKRRQLVRDNQTINGIDFLEVTSEDQKTLSVHFLNPLPGVTGGIPNDSGTDILAKANIQIKGGVRIKNIAVTSVMTSGNVLTVQVDTSGDFSNYTLCLVNSPTDATIPNGFDSQLSVVDFSFKANCPSEFDCKTELVCPPGQRIEPRIDYLAKDFSSFRKVMLDRLSFLQPDWQERNIADLQIALVELLAYAGDHLSYYQDAVATESYLYTARKRKSIRRHARLLDYHMHNGCNARVWVQVQVEAGGTVDGGILRKNTPLLTKGITNEVIITENALQKQLKKRDLTIFETKHNITVRSSQNKIHFYTWGDDACCLTKGSTKATIYHPDYDDLHLKVGQVLIFEELFSPTTGKKTDADFKKRHAVRLIAVHPTTDLLIKRTITDIGTPIVNVSWHEEDALPFSLCISAIGKNGESYNNVSVARGNIVLADHGLTLGQKHNSTDEQTVFNQEITLSSVPETGVYRPTLLHKNITIAETYPHETAVSSWSASKTIFQNPKQATPIINLKDGVEIWEPQKDLLGSNRFVREFVAEIESNGQVELRFGDDVLGQQPGTGVQPKATYRIGTGTAGNVGAESIGRIVWNQGGILKIRNPLPAQGGINRETTEEVRQFAPEAFRTQERAVTEADYAEKTELHPEVQKAVAEFRWTGSWHTVFITIDRKRGRPITKEFKTSISTHLEKYRMAGYDLEIRTPIFVALEIELNVCVKKGYFRSHIKKQLLTVFSNVDLSNNKKGFFHPDNFTFGQALYLSSLYQLVMQVEGVASVEINTFKRQNRSSDGEKEVGFLKPDFNEILQLDNDSNFPENGKIIFNMFGNL